MAITTPILALAEPIERDDNRWALNFPSADYGAAGLNEELKAAPTGAGRALYLTHVTIGTRDNAAAGYTMDARVSLVDGIGDTVFGPIQLQSQGTTTIQKDFDPPLKITDNKALDCVAAAASATAMYAAACLVYVEGFTGDKPLG